MLVCLALLAAAAQALDDPEQKVSAAIKKHIIAKYPDWAGDEIIITFKSAEKTFDRLRALSDQAEFAVLTVSPDFKPVGNVVVPLQVSDGGDSEKILLRTKVEVRKKIAAAAVLIKKGKLIEPADLKLESRDVALLPPKYFVETLTLGGKEAKITIPANSTLFAWMVGEPPLVKRGAEVTVVVTAPGLTVKAKGQALDDGYRDQELKVRRADTRKTIVGKVISPSEVEVKI